MSELFLVFSAPLTQSENTQSNVPSTAFVSIKQLRASVTPFLPWLVSGWLAGVIVCSLRLLMTWRHVRMLRTTGVVVAGDQLISAARRLADRMGIWQTVALLESTVVEVPMVFGWLKPVILLPVTLSTGLRAAQVDAIIAHELAHVRRWDFPVNLLQNVVETILFYHPAVWCVSGIMRQERENCCDDIPSEVCGDKVTYARALLHLEELRHPEQLVLAASGGDLMTRVRRLIALASADGSVRGLAGVVALLVVGTALAGMRLVSATNSTRLEGSLPGTIAVGLDGDLTVEFAAISRDPAGEDSWWQPNGEPYSSDFATACETSPLEFDPSSWKMGFIVKCSDPNVAVHASFPQGSGSWGGWTSGQTGPGGKMKKSYVQMTVLNNSDVAKAAAVDVDVFFSREDWRPWKTIALGDNVIKLRASGEFSRRAHVAEASGVQPGELLYAYEDAGRDRVEIVVGWQTGFHSRADLQVEAFDKNGREIEWTNTSTFQHCRTFAFDDTKETIAGYRYRIRYYTDKVSFFNASLIPNQRTQVMHRVVRLNVPQQELTPVKIADNVEAAMKRFASAEYKAETTATVNTNGFRTDVEPVLVKGNAQYHYRSDASRWFVDEKAFTYNQGESEVRPENRMGGFDGALHYSLDSFGSYNLGEEDSSHARLSPTAVFWRAGRTSDWLLGALRRDEARIESERQVDGRRVVRVVSDWTRGERHSRFEIEVLPDHSWLPLSVKIFDGDKLAATETVEELAQSAAGVWYPKRLHWTETPGPYVTTQEKTINVTSFALRDDFKDADFAFEVPLGKAVVDHRSGTTWCNDPWFTTMSPWLGETLDYPRRDLSALREIQSYADEKIDGQAAPAIQAAEWIVGDDPGPWAGDDARPTLLFFFGGRAISPTPKQLVVLKTLAERYKESGLKDQGLNVIGVTSASGTPEMTRQTVKELQVNSPVAIDSPTDDGQGYGKTFAAYGLKSYMGCSLSMQKELFTSRIRPVFQPTPIRVLWRTS